MVLTDFWEKEGNIEAVLLPEETRVRLQRLMQLSCVRSCIRRLIIVLERWFVECSKALKMLIFIKKSVTHAEALQLVIQLCQNSHRYKDSITIYPFETWRMIWDLLLQIWDLHQPWCVIVSKISSAFASSERAQNFLILSISLMLCYQHLDAL